MVASALRVRLLAGTFVLVSVPCTSSYVFAQSRSTRTVLTIHGGAEDFPANPVLDTAIREALKSSDNEPIEYFAEYLETDPFGFEEASLGLAEYIRRKYDGRRIDVVIAVTYLALQFVLHQRATLFANAPVVYAGVAVPNDATRSAHGGLAAVRIGAAYAQTLKLALALHPRTEHVFVLATSASPANVDTVRAALQDVSPWIDLEYIHGETVSRLLDAVKAVPPRSVILYIWNRPPDRGNVVYPHEIVRTLAEAASAPVYVTIDSHIGSGAVGGVVRRTRETGVRLGAMARMILDGVRAQDIPVEDALTVPTVDWRQVQRWGINVSHLPPGTDIRFKAPTIWEAYRSSVIAAVVVVSAQLALITALLTQRARRRRAEAVVRASEATVRASYERIRHLAGRLINAQESARAAIARDLHDGVCQELVGVAMGVGSLKRSFGSIQSPHPQQALSKLEHMTHDLLEGVRRLSHDLHPVSLQLLGLGAALNAHCIEVEKRYDVQASFRCNGELGHIDPDVALCLFRIAQEALRNGAVHGDARRLAVTIARDAGYIELTIADDGVGFDLAVVRREAGGLGLVSMEERVHVVGGSVEIVTARRQGTRIRVRVPADAHAGGMTGETAPAVRMPDRPSRSA
jgi:signal transduction histidine kinase